MITRIRAQPSDAQLILMRRRLSQSHSPLQDSLAKTKFNGDFVAGQLSKLTKSQVLIPGINCDKLHFWLFPMVVVGSY